MMLQVRAFEGLMAETAGNKRWWTTPKATIVAFGAALTFAVTLVANIHTIAGWFGFGAGAPVAISLKLKDLTRTRTVESTEQYVIFASFDKTGSTPLHDCKFLIDQGPNQSTGKLIFSFSSTFDMPAGKFSKDILPVGFTSGFIMSADFPTVNISMACDKASSEAVSVDLGSAKQQ